MYLCEDGKKERRGDLRSSERLRFAATEKATRTLMKGGLRGTPKHDSKFQIYFIHLCPKVHNLLYLRHLELRTRQKVNNIKFLVNILNIKKIK